MELPAPLAPGARLGPYTVVRTLGEGGMGTVYEATGPDPAGPERVRPVALKVLSPWLVTDLGRAQFEREIEICRQLSHPNTVVILDHGETSEGSLYYAMELLEGLDLRRLVDEDGPQSAARTVRILHPIAGALGEVHARGLVHRDVKPPNIVLAQPSGVPDVAKLVDFGLVTPLASLGRSSREAPVIGTPRYTAPELLATEGDVTPATDLYALALVAFFLLTGEHAFDGSCSMEILRKQREQPAPSLLEWGVSADLAGLVAWCLRKSPQERPADAETVRAALERCADASRWDAEEARAWWTSWRAKDAAQRAAVD